MLPRLVTVALVAAGFTVFSLDTHALEECPNINGTYGELSDDVLVPVTYRMVTRNGRRYMRRTSNRKVSETPVLNETPDLPESESQRYYYCQDGRLYLFRVDPVQRRNMSQGFILPQTPEMSDVLFDLIRRARRALDPFMTREMDIRSFLHTEVFMRDGGLFDRIIRSEVAYTNPRTGETRLFEDEPGAEVPFAFPMPITRRHQLIRR